MSARRFKVPIAIISLVDHDRIWFKAHHGIDVKQIGKDPGLCASAIVQGAPYVLTDASIDSRSLANPLVTGALGLRFYAGVPLRTSDGHNLGTLCVIDRAPRQVTTEELEDLSDLAALVIDQMELRLAARSAVEQCDLMAREIDHRVMNSLQFIAGLLFMQAEITPTHAARTQLRAASDRVAAVARIHRHFYQNPTEIMCLASFLERLCEDMSSALGTELHLEADPIDVPSILLQPIGLLINELVTNAIKHGGGRITIGAHADQGSLTLQVCDEGGGLPKDFDPAAMTDSLGMRVATGLSRQLGGTLVARPNPSGKGSCFSAEFALPINGEDALKTPSSTQSSG